MKRHSFLNIARNSFKILFFISYIYNSRYIKCTEDSLRIPVFVHKYTNKLGINLIIANRTLLLAIDTLNEGIRLFQDGTEACNKGKQSYFFQNYQANNTFSIIEDTNCYDPKLSSSATWCYNTNKCHISLYQPFECEKNGEFPDPVVSSTFYSFLHFNERTYDGITKVETALEGNEMILVPWITPELLLKEFPIKLIRSDLCNGNGENWPSFHSFDGFIGLVGSSISCRGISLWNEVLMLYNSSKYSLDIDFENSSLSSIYLTDLPSYWNSNLILWSEPKQSGSIFDDALGVFQIYNIKICESMIMQDVSSNWLAALDFSSTCISIPPFLFTRIMKWIPIECPNLNNQTNNLDNSSNSTIYPYSSLCIIKKKPLPLISFELSQLYSEKDPIIIFLNDYIIHYNNIDYLCILNSTQSLTGKMSYVPSNDDYIASYYFPTLSSSNTPLILLGTLFLKSYGVIIDSNSSKIGFYPKYPENKIHSNIININCFPKKKCIGNSKYQSSINECIPPECSDWILYDLDEKTNTCVINRIYPIIIAFIIFIVTFFELYIMYLKQFILDKSSSISNS